MTLRQSARERSSEDLRLHQLPHDARHRASMSDDIFFSNELIYKLQRVRRRGNPIQILSGNFDQP
jgi:hypothetical protein